MFSFCLFLGLASSSFAQNWPLSNESRDIHLNGQIYSLSYDTQGNASLQKKSAQAGGQSLLVVAQSERHAFTQLDNQPVQLELQGELKDFWFFDGGTGEVKRASGPGVLYTCACEEVGAGECEPITTYDNLGPRTSCRAVKGCAKGCKLTIRSVIVGGIQVSNSLLVVQAASLKVLP